MRQRHASFVERVSSKNDGCKDDDGYMACNGGFRSFVVPLLLLLLLLLLVVVVFSLSYDNNNNHNHNSGGGSSGMENEKTRYMRCCR
jgi:hypothetical protein